MTEEKTCKNCSQVIEFRQSKTGGWYTSNPGFPPGHPNYLHSNTCGKDVSAEVAQRKEDVKTFMPGSEVPKDNAVVKLYDKCLVDAEKLLSGRSWLQDTSPERVAEEIHKAAITLFLQTSRRY